VPVYRLTEEIRFPPPELAEPEGLLAVGGDLRPERLLEAYRRGIFPWYAQCDPILWFCPDPRYVIRPRDVRVSRSLVKTLRRGVFEIRSDTAFDRVIAHCAQVPRPRQEGTWITEEMQEAYSLLHRLGYAHCVETWFAGELVGGLYGVSLGKCFFGESMFSLRPDASKVAFVALARQLERWGFELIDCQVYTDHLARFGASPWPRRRFLEELADLIQAATRRGNWNVMIPLEEATRRPKT